MSLLDIETWIGGLGLGFIILGILLLAIWIWAIIDIIRRPELNDLMKVIWMVVVIAFPFVGVILYLIFGRRTSSNTESRETRY